MATGWWYDIDLDMLRKMNEAMARAQCKDSSVHCSIPPGYQGARVPPFALKDWKVPDADVAFADGPLVADTEVAQLRQELDEARQKITSLERQNAELRKAESTARNAFADVWDAIYELFPAEDVADVNGMLFVDALRHLLARTRNREPLARESREPKWAAASWRWGARSRP